LLGGVDISLRSSAKKENLMHKLDAIGSGRRLQARLAAQFGRARRASRSRTVLMAIAIFAATAVVGGSAAVLSPATASASAPTALVYGPSVDTSPSCSSNIPYSTFKPSPGSATPCGEVASLEAQGWNVTVATASQWDAMTQTQFASYQLLVLGDPDCGAVSSISSAVSNESTWAPAVNGTILMIGTDPVYHEQGDPSSGQTTPDPAKLLYQGLAYAGAQAGKTGLYLDLSCYYMGAGANTDAPILDGIESGFTVKGAGCTSSIHVVAAAQQLIGVTDADLSNWGCSTHEYFYSWPSDFVPYVLDTTDSCPHPYSPPDGTASGCPYIVARGGGISAGGVTLTAPSSGAGFGTNQTLTASAELDGSPVSGASVTLTCVSGPDAGDTTTVTTDSSGNATYTYTSSTPGTDEWQATYTPSGGSTDTSSDAAVVWNEASTSFTASPSPTSTGYGNTVTLSASGLPSPATGSVSFAANGSTLCSGTVASGGASCATAVLPPGTYSVTATYSGDSTYLGSTASTSFTINAADGTPTTAVNDAGDNQAWHGTETVGAAAYDTASVATASGGSAPTGTVTYSFYAGGNCSTGLVSTDQVTLSGGNVPNSSATAALAPGSYSYSAAYSGDSNYASGTSSCAGFVVAAGTPTLGATVDDAGGAVPWSGSETSGASAYDTATVTGVGGFTPTGTVTYYLYANGSCSGSPTETDLVTLSGGNVPNSSASAALAAGNYSYTTAYSGDADYSAASGACQSFDVANASSTTTATVDDATANAGWSGTETVGASAYATATVSAAGGFTPSGSVTYSLFSGGSCAGTALTTDTETLASGNVPNSSTPAALGAGTYSFQAVYSGDGNFAGSTSQCESFTVGQTSVTASGSVEDASSNDSAWSGSEPNGSSAIATASVSGLSGFAPSGTVTYSLFDGDTCSGSAVSTDTVTLANGEVPDSSATGALAAGSYSFQASYSGDADYAPATGGCERFAVLAPLTSAVTGPPSLAIVIGGGKSTAGATGGSGGGGSSTGGDNRGTSVVMHVMSGEVVDAHYSCQDAAGGPGIASCVGSVGNGAPLNTQTVGVHSFTVTSTSLDGETATKTVEYVVVLTNWFTVRHVVVHPDPESKPGQPDTDQDGIVAFDLSAPGPGKFTVLETAPPHTAAGVATAGKAHRVVYATAQMTAKRAGTLRFWVVPNAVGKGLEEGHPHHLWLQMVVTFKPTHGKARQEVFYGINASLEPAGSN
jgi:hypothetical protein